MNCDFSTFSRLHLLFSDSFSSLNFSLLLFSYSLLWLLPPLLVHLSILSEIWFLNLLPWWFVQKIDHGFYVAGGHKLNLEGFSFMVIRIHATTSRSQQLGIMRLEVPRKLATLVEGKINRILLQISLVSNMYKNMWKPWKSNVYSGKTVPSNIPTPIESSIVFHILKSLQCTEGAEFRGPGWYCKDRLDVKKTDLIVPWKKRGIWEWQRQLGWQPTSQYNMIFLKVKYG